MALPPGSPLYLAQLAEVARSEQPEKVVEFHTLYFFAVTVRVAGLGLSVCASLDSEALWAVTGLVLAGPVPYLYLLARRALDLRDILAFPPWRLMRNIAETNRRDSER